MYKISSVWEPYFNEIIPKKRAELFSDISTENTNPDERGIIGLLFKKRFGTASPDGNEKDSFLGAILDMILLYERNSFFKKLLRREVLKDLEKLCLLDPAFSNEMDKAILFYELKNSLDRYFSTCRGNGYHRKFFGVMASSEDEQINYTRECAWNMSTGLSMRFGLEKEMSLFNKAAESSLTSFDPEYSVWLLQKNTPLN